MSDNPRVFISYSHDSPEHAQRVLAFSERLRDDGIDAQVDQYVNGAPDEGWPRWMLNELDKAEFVLVVCTETYYRRFRGHEQPGTGNGVDWEGALITLDVYKNRSRTMKFVPVLFDSTDERYIPDPLGSVTHYILDSEPAYQRLKRFLLGRAGVQPRPVGKVQREEPKHVEPLAFPAESPSGGAERPTISSGLPQKIAPTRVRHSAEQLIGREAELARLDEAWTDPTTNVLTIVAFGGVGKTSLVAHWAAGLAKRGYDGASYFDWSFYSQGTREQGGASADQFINRALEFFGDATMAASAASPWDKGARLAQLVAERRALLVLDGLEPLQYPPGPLTGELRDPAIAALLKGLAQGNAGLCAVTTRERVTDLTPFRGSTAPELQLHHLSIPAGVELLGTLGVKGSMKELEEFVKEVAGHALTLNLLGRYLVRAHGGDIRRRDRVRLEKADASIQGGHAFKAMAAYERWLAEGDKEGERQLAILRLMGLFDRPADAACLEALSQPPAITGLTEPIVGLAEEDWNLAVAELGECGLVSVPEEAGSGAIDAHPLIREYFAQRLRDDAPEAWREAHSRIFEYLQDSEEYQPETLEGLQPLYQAVAHGCHAQRHEEACQGVYLKRILRGNDFYSIRQLGAIGTELGAVACFFDQPWTIVSPLLTPQTKGWILGQAAIRLRALGRPTEALQPMRTGLAMRIEHEDWKNAAIAASNLSELEVVLGGVSAAVIDAEQAVRHADRSGDLIQRMFRCTTLADALHQAGRHDAARTLFLAAEEMQAETLQTFPVLYSLRGFQYHDLLLRQAERTAWSFMISRRELTAAQGGGDAEETAICREVEGRIARILRWHESHVSPIIDIARDYLVLGRTLLYLFLIEEDPSTIQPAQVSQSMNFTAAQDHLDAAVNGLRRAGQIDALPSSLLSRAWLRLLQGDTDAARTDLDEAWEIAARGPMRLHMADIHLYRARLFHAVQPYPWDSPHADLAAARRLIEECGYWRRKEELEDAEAAAKNW
jgi:tetratricopeptide (TPR) repeat protein